MSETFIDTVTQGQQVTFSADFYNTDDTPFVVSTPVTWVIRDNNNNMVMNGTAAQDNVNAALWTAIINIPDSVPVSNVGERYSILWVATGTTPPGLSQPSIQQQSSYFQVTGATDFDFFELDRMQLENTALSDSIALPSGSSITSMQVQLLDQYGNIIFDSSALTGSDIPEGVNLDGQVIYTYAGTQPVALMTVTNAGALPFVISWKYTLNNIVEQEYHFLYVVNAKMMITVNSLRRTIDKARQQNPNPVLQLTDMDLVEYVNQGIALLNAAKPCVTSFNISSLPDVFFYPLINAAAYCALSAQYLAEGQAAFEFNGQSVSLSVDRTQYTDTALSRFTSYIEDQLPSTKRMWNRSTGGTGQPVGSLGINFGPSTGFIGFDSRNNLFTQILLNNV
jgi:hypothetical protein